MVVRGCRGKRERDEYMKHPGFFRAVQLFFMILSKWIHDIMYLSKAIKYRTKRVNSHVNYRLQLIILYKPWFFSCTTWLLDVKWGDHAGVGGPELVYGKSVYFPQNFSVDLQLF